MILDVCRLESTGNLFTNIASPEKLNENFELHAGTPHCTEEVSEEGRPRQIFQGSQPSFPVHLLFTCSITPQTCTFAP